MQVEKYSVSICDKAAVLYSLSCNISSSNCYLNFFSICRIISSSIHLTCNISTSDAFQLVVTFLSGHFTKDCFGSYITRTFIWSISRIFAKIVGNPRPLSSTTLYLRGKIWRNRLSPPRVGYRKCDRLLFLNMLKTVADQKPSPVVVLVVLGSPEGPLVLPMLWSFRITSAALYWGSCVVSTECKYPTLTTCVNDVNCLQNSL